MNTISQFRLAIVVFLLIGSSFIAQAQIKNESSISQQGFWVVETPRKGQQCTVRFYTNDHKLVYEETMGQRLNIARQHTKRQLNAALEQAMFVWNATHQVPTDRQWVAVQFDKK